MLKDLNPGMYDIAKMIYDTKGSVLNCEVAEEWCRRNKLNPQDTIAQLVHLGLFSIVSENVFQVNLTEIPILEGMKGSINILNKFIQTGENDLKNMIDKRNYLIDAIEKNKQESINPEFQKA